MAAAGSLPAGAPRSGLPGSGHTPVWSTSYSAAQQHCTCSSSWNTRCNNASLPKRRPLWQTKTPAATEGASGERGPGPGLRQGPWGERNARGPGREPGGADGAPEAETGGLLLRGPAGTAWSGAGERIQMCAMRAGAGQGGGRGAYAKTQPQARRGHKPHQLL